MANPKPYVAIATACEKVLRETDNVLTIVRVVDTFTIPPIPPEIQNPAIKLSVVLMLRSGEVNGEHEIKLQVHNPDGSTKPLTTWKADFKGGHNSATLQADIDFVIAKSGLHWIEVLWYGETLTKFPIKLAMQPVAEKSSQAAPS